MKSQLIIYPEFDKRIERDYLYSVSVTQGTRTEPLPVYNHTEDSRVNRNPVDDNRADEYRRFSTFAFAGEGVRVDIRVNRDFHDYTVMPSAKKFRHTFQGGIISVYLDHPDYFLIRLDGKDHTILSVFADAPETELPAAGENLYLVEGWQEVKGGVLKITQPNTTVYIPAGAVLNARVEILADHCRVIGRGAIVDPAGDIYRYDASAFNTEVVLLVQAANDTLIDGIHLLDSKAFNIEIIGKWQKTWAEGNRVRNTKILATQMCTDGITFCYYTRDSLAEHCFVYCGDNALVYEEYAHYRDITVGTTCNAVFPQTDVVDSSVEDVYIFRADEGIVNCEYCGENGITKLENHTIRNLNAVDLTFTPYFLYVEIPTVNPVVTARGGLTIENVWLSDLHDTRTPVFYRNLAGGDYQITLKNLSIGGKAVRKISHETTGGEVFFGAHTFRYLMEDHFDPCVFPNRRTVDYQNTINLCIGKYQVYFEFPIIEEPEEILLPAEQLQAELRTDRMAKTELRNGVRYVRLSDLVKSGMAKSVGRKENTVTIIPNVNTGNLLLPDRGIVSKYTEHICYASHLVVLKEDGETVYRVINTRSHDKVGIFRMVKEEIQKYGEGVYCLSFWARSKRKERIQAVIDYSASPAVREFFEVCSEWKACRMDFSVDPAQLCEAKIAMILCGKDGCPVETFDVKNIALKKRK